MNNSHRFKSIQPVAIILMAISLTLLMGCAGPTTETTFEREALPAPAKESEAMEVEETAAIGEDAIGRYLTFEKSLETTLSAPLMVVEPDLLDRYLAGREIKAAPFHSSIAEMDQLDRSLAARAINAAPFQPTSSEADLLDRYLDAVESQAAPFQARVSEPDLLDRVLNLGQVEDGIGKNNITESDVLERFLESNSD